MNLRREIAFSFTLALSFGTLCVHSAFAQIDSAGAGSADAVSSDAEFWRKRSDGWFWYKDPKPPIQPVPVRPPVSATPAKPVKAAEVLAHEALTRRADELMKIAFISPTKENVEAYLRLQTIVVNKSSQFADVWQRVMWENPDMDFATQGRPVNSAAISVYDRELDQSKRKVIAALGREHGLMFFFKSDCPYCHQFAPLLRAFAAQYGIRIVPVSLDGRGLPDFPDFSNDAGQAAKLQVSAVPALYLVNPATNVMKPIGFGILSESELANRLYTITVNPNLAAEDAKLRITATQRSIP